MFLSAELYADPEILIDTGKGRLTVLEHGKTLLELDGIAVGRFGTSDNKQLGDGMTPRGKYRVGWIKQSLQFEQFIGINYPAPKDAERGLKLGIIDKNTYQHIMDSHRKHEIPPQTTPLGGFLGIHGLGRADPVVHKRYNWTRGCIAITDEQLEQLSPWINKGTLVEIR